MSIANNRTVYVIDAAVSDFGSLLACLGPDDRCILIDPDHDGMAQLAHALQGESGIDALHIISHGSPGNMALGSASLHAANLADYGAQLQTIANALAPDGDLLIYGCNVGQGETGRAFIEQLSQLTGADVAASEDFTASAESGGNSELEIQTGAVEATPLNLNGTAVTLGLLDTASNFSYADALIAAQFSNWAYENSATQREINLKSAGWTPIANVWLTDIAGQSAGFSEHGGGYEVANAFAFAAKRILADGKVEYAISFEGSNTPAEQLADWTTTNFSEYGWSKYYASLMPLVAEVYGQALTDKITNGKNVSIVVTGHSLGGAAASVCFADLAIPYGQNLWVESHAPLQDGARIYDAARLNAWTDSQIASLVSNTTVYTFGAPSYWIEPTKFDAAQWTAFLGGVELGAFILTGGVGAAIGLVAGTALVTTVQNSLIKDSTAFDGRIFQFEHEDSGAFRGSDPVSSLGTQDAGKVLDIDITESIHDRYEDNNSAPVMHSMTAYIESIARLISASSLLKTGNGNPMLPLGDGGAATNNLYWANSTGTTSAGNGNDIIVASGAGLTLDPGLGKDVIVIAPVQTYAESYTGNIRPQWGNVTYHLQGLSGEATDALIFMAASAHSGRLNQTISPSRSLRAGRARASLWADGSPQTRNTSWALFIKSSHRAPTGACSNSTSRI